MDGWFLLFDMFLLTVSAALPEARGPEERRYFWGKAGGFRLSGNDFPDCVCVSHINKQGDSRSCGGNPTTSKAIQHVYDNMFWKVLIGWARSVLIIKKVCIFCWSQAAFVALTGLQRSVI